MTCISRCRRITTDGRGVTHAAAARRDAAVQPQVQARLGFGEGASVDLAAGGKEDEEVDELLVGVGDGWAVDQRAVDQLQQDVVVADDDDVLDVVVVDERLKPAEPEERVEDRLRRRLLARWAPRSVAGVDVVGHG